MCLYGCVRTSLSLSGCVIVRGCASCTRPLTEVSCRAAVFWSNHVGVNILDQEVEKKKKEDKWREDGLTAFESNEYLVSCQIISKCLENYHDDALVGYIIIM